MCSFPEHFGLVMGCMRKREVWEKSHTGALNRDPENSVLPSLSDHELQSAKRILLNYIIANNSWNTLGISSPIRNNRVRS